MAKDDDDRRAQEATRPAGNRPDGGALGREDDERPRAADSPRTSSTADQRISVTCAASGDGREATTRRDVVFAGDLRETLDVCDEHAQQLDRGGLVVFASGQGSLSK